MAELIMTGDGSLTVFDPETGDHYHSVHGAIQESQFIYTGCGLDYFNRDSLAIFEAGLGTGLNALLSCIRSSDTGMKLTYTAMEKYPLGIEITNKLNYAEILKGDAGKIFDAIHSCPWETPSAITEQFTLLKIRGDLVTDTLTGLYDLIYFDAFGPDKQPEMWTDKVFRKISGITESGSVLVTYSVKGDVKRILRSYGFKVSLLPGPPGKRQILRAIKI